MISQTAILNRTILNINFAHFRDDSFFGIIVDKLQLDVLHGYNGFADVRVGVVIKRWPLDGPEEVFDDLAAHREVLLLQLAVFTEKFGVEICKLSL